MTVRPIIVHVEQSGQLVFQIITIATALLVGLMGFLAQRRGAAAARLQEKTHAVAVESLSQVATLNGLSPGELLERVEGRSIAATTKPEDRTEAEQMYVTASEDRTLGHPTLDGILLVDAAGNITAADPRAEQITGYPVAELLGQPVELLVPLGEAAVHAVNRTAYIAAPTGRPMLERKDLTLRKRDGTTIPVLIALVPMTTVDGQFVVQAALSIPAPHKEPSP